MARRGTCGAADHGGAHRGRPGRPGRRRTDRDARAVDAPGRRRDRVVGTGEGAVAQVLRGPVGGLRPAVVSALPLRRRTGGVGRRRPDPGGPAGHPGGCRSLRQRRPEHRREGRRAGAAHRVLGPGPALQLPGGPHRYRLRRPAHRRRLLLPGRAGRRPGLRRLRRRRPARVDGEARHRTDRTGRVRPAGPRTARPGTAPEQGAVRRTLAGRGRHRVLRGGRLRRRPRHPGGRGTQPVRRPTSRSTRRSPPRWPT